ncbi:hypothetical protein KSP40_PGU014067 [Platanthera guangdongensis]|uniref:Maturase K n=1 Tax=Platanthera guangdongensis TaxID=2320717 RepID=A0ABR2MEW0_9ASPA
MGGVQDSEQGKNRCFDEEFEEKLMRKILMKSHYFKNNFRHLFSSAFFRLLLREVFPDANHRFSATFVNL